MLDQLLPVGKMYVRPALLRSPIIFIDELYFVTYALGRKFTTSQLAFGVEPRTKRKKADETTVYIHSVQSGRIRMPYRIAPNILIQIHPIVVAATGLAAVFGITLYESSGLGVEVGFGVGGDAQDAR